MINLFSQEYPEVRLIWDPTTLNAFMEDPLVYYWKYVLGYRQRERSIDLEWGTAWDKAMANYHYNRRDCSNKSEALYRTIENAIARAQATELDKIAAESNKANKKNLSTLIRSIVWYDEKYGDYPFFEPISNVAATLDITLYELPNGEEIKMVVNFDQVVRSKETQQVLIVERKTSVNTLSDFFFKQYDPSVQINTYDWIANKYFETDGVWIEAVQTAVGFSRFDYHECTRFPSQRKDWETTMKYWLNRAFELGKSGEWHNAVNLATQKWESKMRDIERHPRSVWDNLLRADFKQQELWNPYDID